MADGASNRGLGRVPVVGTAVGYLVDVLAQIGSVWVLILESLRWLGRAARGRARIRGEHLATQTVRVGVMSVFIVSLVSGCVGLILVLQMAPPLDEFGRKEVVANIVGVAILRELGPLIAAIVLTGFAGASIAAELGTMVVGEEIEALEAQAINPVRFLVLPRVLGTMIGMVGLAVISNVVAIAAAAFISWAVLEIPVGTFRDNMMDQVKTADFVTGMIKALVFGTLIGVIACTNGLKVQGGAAGVGRATTSTVVQSVVAIVIADLAFTAFFFAWKLN
ncbi:MAG: ABC transporter permease [Phycisphaeraceae bacterium]|nr:ABC transporter permease [Phycisphaeraceae bacterium]